jgi:tetratricopeptide (TPR) repeat protein
MTKYRIRLKTGRVIGPFSKPELFDLKAKGHIKGFEEAQVFPAGNWEPLKNFDFYPDLMDENKTIVQTEGKDEGTFIIDLTKIRQVRTENEMNSMDHGTMAPVQELTETVRIAQPNAPKNTPAEEAKLDPALEELLDESDDRTLINPIAQQEIERQKRQAQKEAEEHERAEKEKALAEAKAKEATELPPAVVPEEPREESTQMIQLEAIKEDLLGEAVEAELSIEAEKKAQKEKKIVIEEDTEEGPDVLPVPKRDKKKKKIIALVAGLAIIYAVFFPEDRSKAPPFKHLEPQIIFPIPFDQAEGKKSEAAYNRGVEHFMRGTYPDIVKAGLSFKESYENDVENRLALNLLVRTYAEELEHSHDKLNDAQTLFNLVQSKRPFLLQDPNGVIGLNLFYMAINKTDAAADVIQRYFKLKPNDLTQDLFAVYLVSLMKLGKLELVKQFYQPLVKTPEKNRYTYRALIDYHMMNQEHEKAMEYADDAIKRLPQNIWFYLIKADLLIREKKVKEAVPFLKRAEEKGLEYNNKFRAKFLELKGLVYAQQGKTKEATEHFAKSLELEDSSSLRLKLADLVASGKNDQTDRLISESKAIKLLLQGKDFFDKKNYELALSSAARATDAFPGHIPSELFLAKVQMQLGLAQQGIKTLEALLGKYPQNKKINMALVNAFIDTYKFNDAKNRIAAISGTEMRDSWEYASANANMYIKMGDTLQAMSWLKKSIALNPLNDHDMFLLAEILIKKGNFDAARTLLHKIMELDPANADYRIAYARLIYETQDDQAAIGYLLDAMNELGENPKLLSEVAILYYRAGKVKAFQDYKKKLESLPYKDKALYEFLIKAALIDERYTEIPVLVEQLLAIEPGDLESMMTAGRVLFEDGKLVEAAKWFKRVQDKLPSYPKVLYYIAKIKFLSGDLDGAMAEIKRDIKENGENDMDLVFMAQIHAKKEEFIEAENTFKKAQKLNPRSYDALIGLADLSTKRNNHDLALDLYKRAIKLKSDEAIVHKKIGDVYRLLGQGTLAIESYKLYLEMNPEASDKNQIEAYIKLMQ